MFILLGTYINELASGGFVSAILYVGYCTITSEKQAKAREIIDHYGRRAAASGHDDLRKALPGGFDQGLIRKICFHSIIQCKEGKEDNGMATEMASFQPNVGRRCVDDVAQDNRYR